MSRKALDEDEQDGPDDQVTIEHKVTRKRVRSKPGATDEAVEKYRHMRDKYETLLSTMERVERKHRRKERHHRESRNRESEELVEWTKTWRQVLDMAIQVVPLRPQPTTSPADQRRVLIDLVQQLCERATDPTQTPQYQALAAKCARRKKRMRKMKIQCGELLAEVQRNRDTLEQHMQAIRRSEKEAVDAKVTQIERLMDDHIQDQLELTSQHNSRSRFDRSHRSERLDRPESSRRHESSHRSQRSGRWEQSQRSERWDNSEKDTPNDVYREQRVSLDDRFDIVARCGITIDRK